MPYANTDQRKSVYSINGQSHLIEFNISSDLKTQTNINTQENYNKNRSTLSSPNNNKKYLKPESALGLGWKQ